MRLSLPFYQSINSCHSFFCTKLRNGKTIHSTNAPNLKLLIIFRRYDAPARRKKNIIDNDIDKCFQHWRLHCPGAFQHWRLHCLRYLRTIVRISSAFQYRLTHVIKCWLKTTASCWASATSPSACSNWTPYRQLLSSLTILYIGFNFVSEFVSTISKTHLNALAEMISNYPTCQVVV
jgi:hypothetical protein